jgi:pullulanase
MERQGRWMQCLRRLLIAAASAGILAGCGGSADSLGVNNPAGVAKRASIKAAVASVPAANMRMHFHRVEGTYSDWGVYSWAGPLVPDTVWITDRFMFNNTDGFGGYVDIPIDTTQSAIQFLVTDGSGNKNCQNNQVENFSSTIATTGQEIWMLEGDCTIYASPPAITYGNLAEAHALWLNGATIAWPSVPTTGSYRLFYAANGGINSDASGVTGADGSVPLTINSSGLSSALQAQYPYVASATALTLAASDASNMASKLTGQFAVAQFDANGNLVQVTSLQMAGLLDSIYATAAADAKLGVSFDRRHVPSFHVWSPTAKSVTLNVYASANATSATQYPMTRNGSTGVWSYEAKDASWTNSAYYTYTVNVLSRWANNAVVSNQVTDPYSLSLNANGVRSFVVDLDSEALKPDGWEDQAIAPLASPTDIVLYETHIRDFSVGDQSVPVAHRGKYMAFTNLGSNGMRHLERLQRAGLTHIHLLPSFDFSSVNETGCTVPVVPNAAPNSTAQQAAVTAVGSNDCFNWGYDPFHYTSPEGSYSTNPNDGIVRVKEFRAMVQALHEVGLRVTMDVVYNHTSDSGQGTNSVLDKIVPTYYYRLNSAGYITNDSCCSDTAAENAMMAKLMIDSTSTWVKHYKIDSFRFDIMGIEPLAVIKKLQAAVNKAAARDIYLYGEGWNMGVVANNARFVTASQFNLYGTGIGSFNDRIRDSVRGGGCCDSGNTLVAQQGFINGAYYDPNAQSTQALGDLLNLSDLVRVGLSGTLKNYSFVNSSGNLVANSQVNYFGQAAGYTENPGEIINYIEAHDNQTLFDINAYKLPTTTSLADRVRVQNMGIAINMLSQGIPFFQIGQDMLRSKSMDQNSYASGDWFNALDFTYQANNFGVGLPIAGSNQQNWPLMSPLLINPTIMPNSVAIATSRDYFTDMLAIRKDTTLFRLRSGQDVMNRLTFYNVGPSQLPGIIAMGLDGQNPNLYPGAKYKSVVVLFNVDKVAKTLNIPAMQGKSLVVHPVQMASTADPVARTATFSSSTGTFMIPPRTTVVFVQR